MLISADAVRAMILYRIIGIILRQLIYVYNYRRHIFASLAPFSRMPQISYHLEKGFDTLDLAIVMHQRNVIHSIYSCQKVDTCRGNIHLTKDSVQFINAVKKTSLNSHTEANYKAKH